MAKKEGIEVDLEKVVCDNLRCLGRGEYTTCYFNKFIDCHYYHLRHLYSEKDVNRYKKIKKKNGNKNRS